MHSWTFLNRTSGLGVIAKQDGGWHIKYHISPPDGLSINDFIDPFTYSLTYYSIDDAYTIINNLGPGALLCWSHILCRLIDLSTSASKLHHHIRLTSQVQLDMQRWLDFYRIGLELV